MKWLMVVIYSGTLSNGDKELYVFTDPAFNNMQACMQAIVDPERIPQFSMKLLQAYNFQFKSIEKVVCLPEEKIKEIDQGKGTSI